MGDQDPSYLYLSGSVDMALTHKTLFLDNPGLPPQILGAALVKATHTILDAEKPLLEDVLSRPEKYLSVIGWTQLGLVAFSIYLLGITALREHGSLIGAVMLQIGCVLVSRYMLYRLVGVTAIAMLLWLTLLLMSLIITFTNKPFTERKKK